MNIVVMGGSRGIGKAIIQRLYKTHTCIAVARASKELEEMKSEFGCSIYTCDVSKAKEVTHTIEEILKSQGSIDVLINSAGIWIEGALETNDLSTIQATVEINVLGTIYATHAVLPCMKKVGSGLIVNVGSQSGLRAKAERSVYTATKWAITGFSRALNEELGPKNIRVTALYPGTTDTSLFSRAGSTKELSKAMTADQVAETVEWLLTLPPSVTISDLGIKATLRG